MATAKQIAAAKQNIKKARAAWQTMSKTQHAKAQPEGKNREEPGTSGEGNYFRIVVRPKEEFETFRNQDVGEPGGLQRVAGQRKNGTWDTQAWLISKDNAHMSGNKLIADSEDAKKLLADLGKKPVHEKGDIFSAKE